MLCKPLFRNKLSDFFVACGYISLFMFVIFANKVSAQPFGVGVFDANVGFGSQTNISIATGGNVAIYITPSGSGTLGTGSSSVTVTSTDVVGYKLYLRALTSTNLTNGSYDIPASSNVAPGALSVDTWGYNVDGSSNFVGITGSDTLIKSATGPYSSGDTTTFTYGLKVDNAKPSGSYATTVMYTVVPQTT